ncbi:type-2 ice-structuring protein-like isoform X2 [Onychostoma macrolepis]|uniref:type-2 ice-structuring protein-like isoform X2 n=1 Tax=Onychostoma macrolepis TaxID=369639 RepID=UPI001BEE84AC|nr:type-2 ice-structuring protein-like isoform X2 [Onychostoma macrolepis]XP_058635368.1 type-2 ice-structuring protein-like isoform X2 [Onychostoma macrolepis]XP_058635375.1 type-2 ice-structuring protein-like isoform X2 [Onychostoma macrolepis]XP_058635387.1 type-2 ice-structuring protein-like isoform X2 [Onychostoma macrolepis]XP_058635391.1 type-2 ice-structuring protein-like isoform X2 [Onychostoma macrolepis]XP_058635400.1 type-2 ice-structuring protein-like isoform X2 [Onychostoma macro
MAMLGSLLLFIMFSMGNTEDLPYPVGIDKNCHYGWTPFGDRCYKFFSQSISWIAAERKCIDQHANLASVHSELENDFLLSLVPSSKRCWFGVHDGVQEGAWLWSDGTPYDYTNWCADEPNNINVENCGEISWTSDRCWNDAGCSASVGYVCAKDL